MIETVSVVMCTYNGEMFLREQLDSILQQTYPIYEVIVQDDCSTDHTVDIIQEYVEKNPEKIKLFVNEKNKGYNENFKCACMRANGQFLAISDQDDIWFPEKIEEQVRAIGEHDICFCSLVLGDCRQYATCVNFSLEGLLFRSCLYGHTMLVRTSFAQQNDAWISGFTYDWSLSVNAQLGKGIVRIGKALNWHRVHNHAATFISSQQHLKLRKANPTWHPYVYGLKIYRDLQLTVVWQRFQQHVLEHTSKDKHPLANHICQLMLSRSYFSLFRLCLLTMRHRATIYPNKEKTKGIMGCVRSFFYPLIAAYHCKGFA